MPRTGVGDDGVGQAAVAEPGQVGRGGLAAGHQHDVRVGDVGGVNRPSDHDTGFAGQRLDVGRVRRARQPDRRHPQPTRATRWLRSAHHATGHHRQRVFGVQPQVVDVRQHTVGGAAGELAQLVQPGLQQRRVAAELVDDEAGDQRLVGRFEHCKGAEQVREQSAAVDVSNQHNGKASRAGKPQIRQIGCAQIDFSWRSGTLANDGVELRPKRLQLDGHHRGEPVAMLDVVTRSDSAHHLTAHYELRRAVATRLEQHWVEPHARRKSCGPGLHRLRAADFAALDSDRGVVGHVLGLERRHADTLAGQ